MANHLWKVRAKKASGKISAGMEVEIIRQGGLTGKPTIDEISKAFKEKYGIEVQSASGLDISEA